MGIWILLLNLGLKCDLGESEGLVGVEELFYISECKWIFRRFLFFFFIAIIGGK